MYVQRNSLVCSRNYCCYVSATMGSRSIFVDTHVAVNSTKRLNCATGTQKWVTFALQTSYKSLRTDDNNIRGQVTKFPELWYSTVMGGHMTTLI